MEHQMSLQEQKAQHRKIAIATLVGTTIEWYDYFVYAMVAGLIFDKLFFKPAGDTIATLLVFASVGIAFFFRPLGAFISGYLGDKIGRKAVLAMTLLMMGLATTAIGLLPTYESIGVAAPIILLLLRIIQGISAGGEWGAAVLLAVEHAPDEKRGMFSSFPQLGVPLGLLLASLVLVAMTGFISPGEAFQEWGWRVPFLLSIILLVLGVWIRRSVEESPIFTEMQEKKSVSQRPIGHLFKHHKMMIFMASLLIAGTTCVGYMTAGGFVQNYTTKNLGLDRTTILSIVAFSAVVWTLSTWYTAKLSDQFGRKPVYIWSFVLLVVSAIALFPLLNTANYTYITIALVLLSAGIGATYGVNAVFYSELYPSSIRFSGISITYAIGSILGGAFAPFVAAAILKSTGSTTFITVYLTVVACLGLLSVFLFKDRTRIPLGPEHEEEQQKSPFTWK